jgi:fatty acid desaturase
VSEPRRVEYKGAPLEAEKGPGLGCFWLQIAVLAVVVVLTPLSAAWEWPVLVTIVLMALTLVLLLFVGQTVIFLLRLVAADRRAAGRRRPMRSSSPTVGEIEDETAQDENHEDATPPGDGPG